MGPSELALLRVVAQRLAGPQPATAGEAVRWLTAVQAQDLPGALVSVALRTTSGTRADVEAALATGELVRSWPMRGTLHLVAGEDLGWMLALTGPRMLASIATRRAGLGLDASVLDRAREIAVGALTGGQALPRRALLAQWTAAGLPTAGQGGAHLLSHLAQTAVVCLGPMGDGGQHVVLLDEWVHRPRRLERGQALAALVERYLRSHGPATVADVQRWTGLTVTDVRAGLVQVRHRLAVLEVDGVEHYLDPATPDVLAAHRRDAGRTRLLPGFDELVLGYADRTCTVPAEFAGRVVPGGNGMFLRTVVDGGRAVGTWATTRQGSIDATPFTDFRAPVAACLPRLHAALP